MAQAKRKKRKQKRAASAARPKPVATEPDAAAPPEPRPSRAERTEAKNAAARAALEPLAEGERPLAVTIGAATALLLGLVEIPLYFLWSGDERPALPGFLFFTALMCVMAWGMYRLKYWAVLGFQALLAIIILIFSLLALRFQDIWDLLIATAVIVPASALFVFMVKAMARIQMPGRGA